MVSSSQLLLRSCCSFVTRRGLTLLSWAASLVLAALQISHGNRDNEQIPGMLPFRVESALLYFNVDHVLRVVLERVEA
jgi:hypothetical protein